MGLVGEAIFIKDRELVHGLLPIATGTIPFGSDIAQGQPDQLAGCVV